jgi:hypothetical protein
MLDCRVIGNIEDVRKACALDRICVAYNSFGHLKYNVLPKSLWQPVHWNNTAPFQFVAWTKFNMCACGMHHCDGACKPLSPAGYQCACADGFYATTGGCTRHADQEHLAIATDSSRTYTHFSGRDSPFADLSVIDISAWQVGGTTAMCNLRSSVCRCLPFACT